MTEQKSNEINENKEVVSEVKEDVTLSIPDCTNPNEVNGLEWIEEDDPQYQKILAFNDPKRPLMKTAPGERMDCYIDKAYIYKTTDDTFVVGLVPRVQFAVNMIKYPDLAGEYVINEIIATDTSSRPFKYQIDHRQRVDLTFLNHIIDLNRPDILDPQTIFENEDNFKAISNEWCKRKWLPEKINDAIQNLPNDRSDMIDDRIVDLIESNPNFKRALEQWRKEHWVNDKQADKYAKSGEPIFTIDDELSFAVSIANESGQAN